MSQFSFYTVYLRCQRKTAGLLTALLPSVRPSELLEFKTFVKLACSFFERVMYYVILSMQVGNDEL